jgi:PTS system nitrogen regulatory IIA component
MLELSTVLSLQRTHCGLSGGSKKRLFETVASLVSESDSGLASSEVYGSLLAREKLGSTALGSGIAIPHCRISGCSQAQGFLFTLSEAIDFDAPDGKPVDVLFVLLVPEEAHQEHLNILAGLAKLLSIDAYCQSLRDASSAQDLFDAATGFSLE